MRDWFQAYREHESIFMKPNFSHSSYFPLPVTGLSSRDETQTLAPPENRRTVERGEGITPEQVIAFMTERVRELAAQVPGHVQLDVRAIKGKIFEEIKFRAYSEHTGHSLETLDPADCIAELANKAKGKTEAEMLRKNAETLLARAAALEGAGGE